jgi:hypothetical protein
VVWNTSLRYGILVAVRREIIFVLRDILCRQSIFTFPPGIVSKQVFSLQKCGQLVIMRSGHNSSGRNMDEGRLGTPAQQPIALAC